MPGADRLEFQSATPEFQTARFSPFSHRRSHRVAGARKGYALNQGRGSVFYQRQKITNFT